MGVNIDVEVSVYAGDKHQEVLTWLQENDEEGFDFRQPDPALSEETVIRGRVCDSRSISFEDRSRAFFEDVHARFHVQIVVDIKWPDFGERELICLGTLGEFKTVEIALSEMLDRLGQLDLYPPEKSGDLATDLDNLQAHIEAIREKARSALQDVWC